MTSTVGRDTSIFSFPKEIVWQLISWFEGLIQKYKHRGCLKVLLPSNPRSLLLKQSPLDVAWWVLHTERTGRVPSKPQKKLSHWQQPESWGQNSHGEEWDTKTSCTFKTNFCYNQGKERQTDPLQGIRSEATKPHINMGSLFPRDKYLKVI